MGLILALVMELGSASEGMGSRTGSQPPRQSMRGALLGDMGQDVLVSTRAPCECLCPAYPGDPPWRPMTCYILMSLQGPDRPEWVGRSGSERSR